MDVLTLIALALLAIVVAALIAVSMMLGRLGRAHKELGTRVRQLRDEFDALSGGVTGAGRRLVQVEQGLRRLDERQDQLELQGGGNKAFRQAIELAHKGANTEELVSSCGLSRGEAELVMMLHQLDSK